MVTLAQLAGALAIATSVGGGSFAAVDSWQSLRREVAENTTARLLQEFERLSLIRKQRQLTQVEWLKFCDYGQRLRIFQACPSR